MDAQTITVTLELAAPKFNLGDKCQILQPVKPDVNDMFQAGLIGVVKAIRCTVHFALTEKGQLSGKTEYNYSLDVINLLEVMNIKSSSPDLIMSIFSIYESRLGPVDANDLAKAA